MKSAVEGRLASSNGRQFCYKTSRESFLKPFSAPVRGALNGTDPFYMCDQSTCTGLSDLSARSDYDLVLKIMQTVESHNRDQHVEPDPRSLRDTLLTVAALSHIEAIKMETGIQLAAAEYGKQLRDTFANAACSRLDAVVEAAAKIHRDPTREYQ
jgi:hypothetical protein